MDKAPQDQQTWADREMDRLAEQATTGDRYGALLGLSDWLMRGGAPEEAGVMRAALEGRPVVDLSEALGVREVTRDDIMTVAEALSQRMDLLATLVRALELRPDTGLMELLMAACRRLWATQAHQKDRQAICEAMARLAEASAEPAEAARWAHEGLRLDPTSARLALIVGRCAKDEQHGPPARVVLTLAARAWPAYRDVRAALIRRRADDGRQASARRMLERWLEREPRSPLARRLAQELAA